MLIEAKASWIQPVRLAGNAVSTSEQDGTLVLESVTDDAMIAFLLRSACDAMLPVSAVAIETLHGCGRAETRCCTERARDAL